MSRFYKLSTAFLGAMVLGLSVVLWAQNETLIINGVSYRFPSSQGGSGEFLGNDGAGNLDWSSPVTPEGLWAGSVIMSTVACPSGFTASTAAAGRYIVGMPAGGTLSGVSGTALTNLENRNHTHLAPNHQHTGPSHTHTGPSHTHSTSSHSHSIGAPSGALVGVALDGGSPWDAASLGHSHGGSTGSAGSGATGASGTAETGASGTGVTGVAGAISTSTTDTNVAPYIQFIACVKD